MPFLNTAFAHPADGCFLDFEFSPGPSVITVGSQRDLFQGLSIHWVIFCSRKGFSDRSSTPAFFPTTPRWILLVKTTVKLSMGKRISKSFGFALDVLRWSVLCLSSSAPHNFTAHFGQKSGLFQLSREDLAQNGILAMSTEVPQPEAGRTGTEKSSDAAGACSAQVEHTWCDLHHLNTGVWGGFILSSDILVPRG